MLATCLDGNNNISILAYAIVDRENEENWVWFLIHFRGAVTWIESQEIQFGHTTSNIVEIANSAILPIRSYGPLRMCIELYLYMMEQKAKQHRLSLTLNEETLTPYAARYMATQEEDAGRMKSYHCIRAGDAFVKRMACGGDVDIGSILNSTFGDITPGRYIKPADFCIMHGPHSCAKRGRRRINRIAGPGEHHSNATNLLVGSSGNRSVEPEEHQMPVELLLVGPIAQQRTPHLCSICKQPGHDRRTCGRGREYAALYGAVSGKHGPSRGRLETWRPRLEPREKSRPRIGPRFCNGRGRVHAALYGARLPTRGPSWGRLETLRSWTGPSQNNAAPYTAAWRQSWYLSKRMKLNRTIRWGLRL
ncbi:hypothetical protein R1sor_016363 [Riccia sorocarpa]|uniref:MULE transposase domain-containing protein n=1 Tax=Riccia sorocarpa TaxID=122646 RepID=A0ABD3HIT7_9MARC